MLRTLACVVLAVLAASSTARAQEPAPEEEATAPEAAPPAVAEPEPAAVPEPPAPKIAVVVVGDPDPSLREAARRIERAVDGRLRVPFDPGLRAALRGEPGETDDGLEEVRRERRRLGLEEDRDAALLSALGRRAGAVALAVVRADTEGPEVLVLDVRNAAFFEGELALAADLSDEQLARFVVRRVRVSTRGAEPAPAVPSPTEAGAAAATAPSPEEPAPQPDFFEQFWPYLVAGALLAGMITAIVLTQSSDGASQPVLRFVPGGGP